jgi:hypothetical protein
MARFDHPDETIGASRLRKGTFFPCATSRKPFLHIADVSVGDCFQPRGGDLHPHNFHLPAADGHVAYLSLRQSPEQQIGDLVELNAMRQYHSQGKGHKQAVRTAGWLGVTK